MTGIHPTAFKNITGLKELYITDITIAITPDYFYGMRHLQILRIVYGIESMKPSNISWDNANLYELDLSRNKIRQVTPYTLRSLWQLEKLDMSYNRELCDFEITSLSQVNSLKILILSFTCIKNNLDFSDVELFQHR